MGEPSLSNTKLPCDLIWLLNLGQPAITGAAQSLCCMVQVLQSPCTCERAAPHMPLRPPQDKRTTVWCTVAYLGRCAVGAPLAVLVVRGQRRRRLGLAARARRARLVRRRLRGAFWGCRLHLHAAAW